MAHEKASTILENFWKNIPTSKHFIQTQHTINIYKKWHLEKTWHG
jgi:hypothetical protein